eukprot:3034466-Prymnesium_polylepis.1
MTTNRSNAQCNTCKISVGAEVSSAVRRCLLWVRDAASGIQSCASFAPNAQELAAQASFDAYLQQRWTSVGVCDRSYSYSTTCTVQRGNRTCEVRDQPCHGSGWGLAGVSGVLSAGWQVTFDADGGGH